MRRVSPRGADTGFFVVAKKPESGTLYLERRKISKILLIEYFGLFYKSSFCFHSFVVWIDVLDPENQPRFGNIRAGFGAYRGSLTQKV